MKIGIFIISHDGIASMITGVGVVVNSVIEAFSEIKDKSLYLTRENVELNCITPYLRKDSPEFDSRSYNIAEQACKTNRGQLIFLPLSFPGNNEGREVTWGNPVQWRTMSKDVASFLRGIQHNYDRMLVFANDAPFSSIRSYASDFEKLRFVWIPHSLGHVFKDEHSSLERIALERDSIEAILQTERDKVGYISNSFRDVLQHDYNIPLDRLLSFINGIYKKSSRFRVSEEGRITKIKKYSIPDNKQLVFSFGRCVFQKGYDVLLPAYQLFLKNNPDYHLVLLSPTETSNASYLSEIERYIHQLPRESITPIFTFDRELPPILLQHRNLKLLVFPSRFEGSPIAPLEALTFSRGGVSLVYSGIPSFMEIFKNSPYGFRVDVLTKENLCSKMNEAVQERICITKPTQSIPDIVENYVNSIDELLKC